MCSSDLEPVNLDDARAQAWGYERGGVVVGKVDANGPAANAGLRVLDFILAVDGKRPRSAQEVKEWIATTKPEGTLEFDLQRGNERGKLKVRITERPGVSPRGAKT